MTDKLAADIQRAQRAKLLIEDSLLVEAKESIEAEFWRLFKTLQPTDTEGLTQVKGMQYIHEKYWQYLQSVISNGKMAQLELERARPRPKGY